ncbi:MAG: DUF1476 domain-containing protein [Alphaproteobacteria bacterium]|nr:DUF1476 domain-containing protein [Alphaproteobacteria bacterium]MDE2630371.1 DUF1476 domain-containing protein [Alphaproteobacteria bacterium]
MADGFEDRKKKHEDKWAHDEELRFKIGARRNKLLGLWAAAELGFSDAAAENYAKAVVAADLAGSEAVFAKLRADFDAAKLARSDHVIRHKMEELLAEAKDQIMRETKR